MSSGFRTSLILLDIKSSVILWHWSLRFVEIYTTLDPQSVTLSLPHTECAVQCCKTFLSLPLFSVFIVTLNPPSQFGDVSTVDVQATGAPK
jgi:hypothetical protein